MIWQSAEKIADALLYEGYLLYPYRGSAVKNRYRWQFGIVAPRQYSAAGGSEPSLMQTQCITERTAESTLQIKVRFLQIESRRVEQFVAATEDWIPVDSLFIDGRELVTWDEAIARNLLISQIQLVDGRAAEIHHFEIEGALETEPVRNGAGELVARVVRERWPIRCVVAVSVEPIDGLNKLTVKLENVTPWAQGGESDRPAALRRSLIAAHTLLAVEPGAFVSMVDAPDYAATSVAACKNLHTWPVLVGDAPQRNLMLSSPIILYDYPAVAPESPGDLFDGTEIDELLTLRLLTLTEEERRQALATDPKAGHVIDRAANLPIEQLERLHGAIRYFGKTVTPAAPVAELELWLNPPGSDAEETRDTAGRTVRKGTRVRLHPGGRADAMDMFLAGQTATVAAVYRDLEEHLHVAVTVDAGNASDIHESNGRYFYFRPDEVEVLEPESHSAQRKARVLVAGIGNMFLGDDGFGSAVVQRLATRALPDWVRVEDFGIRSVHLAYDLLDAAYETTILVDAMPRGEKPGTLYVLEPDAPGATEPHDAHSLSVEAVLGFLKTIGGEPGRVLVVGCEPLSVDPELGLSPVVAGVVDDAADLVLDLIAKAGR